MQTVGLIQAAIERAGITTVSISLLHEVTDMLRTCTRHSSWHAEPRQDVFYQQKITDYQ
ncbi:MAG: hypothetical protein ACRD9S_03710 [Pyrinomonadaceae bacterium]